MSYIENNINKGEKLIWFSRVSTKIIILTYIFVTFVGTFLGYVFEIGIFTSIVLCLVLYTPKAILDYFGNEFGITSKRVISRKGIISRNVDEMNFNSIESINIDQNIILRLLNIGTLRISGRGTSNVRLLNIDDPINIRKKIKHKF